MTIKSEMTSKTLKEIEKITGGKLTLGKLLYAIREADEVSQTEFAKKLRISKQHLSGIENGKTFVSAQLAAKYASLLGYSKEQFIRLALQDEIDRYHLGVEIEVYKKTRKGRDAA